MYYLQTNKPANQPAIQPTTQPTNGPSRWLTGLPAWNWKFKVFSITTQIQIKASW